MNKLIETFKNDFPSIAIDVQECLELLSQVLEDGIGSIKDKLGSIVDDRNYEKLKTYIEIIRLIDKYTASLNEFSSILSVDDSFEIIENEPININNDDFRVDPNIPYIMNLHIKSLMDLKFLVIDMKLMIGRLFY